MQQTSAIYRRVSRRVSRIGGGEGCWGGKPKWKIQNFIERIRRTRRIRHDQARNNARENIFVENKLRGELRNERRAMYFSATEFKSSCCLPSKHDSSIHLILREARAEARGKHSRYGPPGFAERTTVFSAETLLVRATFLFLSVDSFAAARRSLRKLSDQLREEAFLVDGFTVTLVCIVYRGPVDSLFLSREEDEKARSKSRVCSHERARARVRARALTLDSTRRALSSGLAS